MANDIAPGWISFEEHSIYGAHVREMPVNTITIHDPVREDSTIEAWDTTDVNWRDMATAMANELRDRLPTTSTIDRATLWYKPDPADLPLFVDSFLLDIDGTVAAPGYTKAAQETITARDTLGNIAKIVSLDMASGDNWDVQITPTAAGVTDLFAVWTDNAWGWSSRAGHKPSIFIKATRTLNESLRRRYKQT